MTTITLAKSDFFRAAWGLARKGAAQFGGTARAYIAEALRAAYADMRKIGASFGAVTDRVAAPEPALSTADKIMSLADIVSSWSRGARKSFAFRFVMDNAMRVDRFGSKTTFSGKQAAIVDEMFAKYR